MKYKHIAYEENKLLVEQQSNNFRNKINAQLRLIEKYFSNKSLVYCIVNMTNEVNSVHRTIETAKVHLSKFKPSKAMRVVVGIIAPKPFLQIRTDDDQSISYMCPLAIPILLGNTAMMIEVGNLEFGIELENRYQCVQFDHMCNN